MDASRWRVRAEPTVRFRQPGLVDGSLFDRVRAAPERVNDLCPFPSREFEGLVCQEHAIHAPKCNQRHTQRQRLSPGRIQALKRRRGLGSWRKSGFASLLFSARLAGLRLGNSQCRQPRWAPCGYRTQPLPTLSRRLLPRPPPSGPGNRLPTGRIRGQAAPRRCSFAGCWSLG
jgi:hypothetical protein